MRLQAWAVVSASGERMWLWSNWRVIAGPTHCVVERRLAWFA
jgi:hypothetical protein